MTPLPPVRQSVMVPLAVGEAFDLFTRRISEWWPLEARSVSLADAVGCCVEPRVGGRIYETARDGREEIWGHILVWEPPTRLVFTWQPGRSKTEATEVEVRLRGVGSGTRLELEHRHWERLGERAAFFRNLFENGWPGVLLRFAERGAGALELTPVAGPGCLDAQRRTRSSASSLPS